MEKQKGLARLLARQTGQDPERTALLASGRPSLSYGALNALAAVTNRKLNGAGLHRGDRLALVISNGPEAATAFLSLAAGHVCAPLNPAYRAVEFKFYLSDLKPKAVIIEAGLQTAAAEVASELGIPVFYLDPASEAAGAFTIATGAPASEEPDFAEEDEVALVLHTSGTTSRPKMVPLTHSNLLDNARNIARSLELTPDDQCLNVMPLFHVHGLMGALLASLSAGASVFCGSGFDATQFFSWLDECHPTWYTAVPTMHQAILARAARNGGGLDGSRLRFIRSCSSPLPPRVMADLEEVFRVPVVEAYGMTEASHQMACNPLPPGTRKPGSVGIATGPDIAIMGPEGDLLPRTMTGEIVIRGASVTRGYENSPDAADAFHAGWFRTGDQGYLDSDGYLFINGRSKEMINRGGEKISPREIDEVLMEHPAVGQAIAFALPDARLGEDVGAAVVLVEGVGVSESELRHFVARKLTYFKVPRRILFVAEIPKGPTGKPQRIGLAERLQIEAEPVQRAGKSFTTPRNETEVLVESIWRGVLGLTRLSVHENFFDLGGDSGGAARMIARIEMEFGKKLEMATLLDAPTIESLARVLRRTASTRATVSAMQTGGPGTPFFCVHGHPLFLQLARHVATDHPFLTLIPPAVEDLARPFTVENLAAHHARSMREVQPVGPYYLGGWCNDGVVAYEIARQLRLSGEEVGGVVLLDARNPRALGLGAEYGGRPSVGDRMRYHLARLSETPSHEWPPYIAQRCRTIGIQIKRRAWQIGFRLKLLNDRRASSWVRDMEQIVRLAVGNYEPAPYDGPVILIRPEDRARSMREDKTQGWGPVAADLKIHEVPGNHRTIFMPPNVAILGRVLCEMMDGGMPTAADETQTMHAGR